MDANVPVPLLTKADKAMLIHAYVVLRAAEVQVVMPDLARAAHDEMKADTLNAVVKSMRAFLGGDHHGGAKQLMAMPWRSSAARDRAIAELTALRNRNSPRPANKGKMPL